MSLERTEEVVREALLGIMGKYIELAPIKDANEHYVQVVICSHCYTKPSFRWAVDQLAKELFAVFPIFPPEPKDEDEDRKGVAI